MLGPWELASTRAPFFAVALFSRVASKVSVCCSRKCFACSKTASATRREEIPSFRCLRLSWASSDLGPLLRRRGPGFEASPSVLFAVGAWSSLSLRKGGTLVCTPGLAGLAFHLLVFRLLVEVGKRAFLKLFLALRRLLLLRLDRPCPCR